MLTDDERYTRRREAIIERALHFLLDCYRADPGSLSVQTLRSFLHESSAQAWTDPVLAILVERGLVTIETGQDGRRTLYYTSTFRGLAGGEGG